MDLAKVNFDQLKEMSVALNTAKYEDAEGDEVSFYKGKKLKTIAISKEDLVKAFDEAIKSIDEDVVNDLPEDIIDFYNELFAAEEGEATPAAEEGEATPAASDPGDKKAEESTKTEKPAKKTKKPVKKTEKSEKKKKEPVELSVYGHKLDTQAAALDDLIATGKAISLEELAKKSGRSVLGVKGHIKHLRDSRGLKINEKNGMYQLVE